MGGLAAKRMPGGPAFETKPGFFYNAVQLRV